MHKAVIWDGLLIIGKYRETVGGEEIIGFREISFHGSDDFVRTMPWLKIEACGQKASEEYAERGYH